MLKVTFQYWISDLYPEEEDEYLLLLICFKIANFPGDIVHYNFSLYDYHFSLIVMGVKSRLPTAMT